MATKSSSKIVPQERKSSWHWFAFKSFYLTEAKGRPNKTDVFYEKDSVLVSQRIVLVKARNNAEAFRKGVQEAKSFALKKTGKNYYAQNISTRVLKQCRLNEVEQQFNFGGEVTCVSKKVMKASVDAFVATQLGDPSPAGFAHIKFLDNDTLFDLVNELVGIPKS
jgi:hypothetical protein